MNGPSHQEDASTPHDVRRFLSLLHAPGSIFELRVPKYGRYKSTASGYFDSIEAALQAIRRWDGKANAYVTLNQVNPALLARAVNRIVDRAEATTSDADVIWRRWLFVDVDAVRASGISSTEDEVNEARTVTLAVAEFLAGRGWPEPIIAMSGNGFYLLYKIDLPNDDAARDLIAHLLDALASRFNTARAKVDPSVGNASRIIGLVGTLKMKGDSTEERPHRRSYLVSAADVPTVVTRDQLQAMGERRAATASAKVITAGFGSPELVVDILRRHGVEFREQAPDANGITWYHLPRCPFHNDGRAFECGVGQKLPDGAYAGHCFHPEGLRKGWQDFKRALGLSVGVAHHPTPRSLGRPEILITERHLHEISGDGWDSLRNRERRLYRHGHVVADVVRDDDGRPRITHLSVPALRGRVDRAATWLRADKNGLHPVAPPKAVIEDMLALPDDLPALKGIVGTPTFASDGALDPRPGYQPATKLFYEPSGGPLAPISDQPDASDLRKAKLIFQELLGDFPFADDSSRAHAIAVPVTAAAREMIDGPTPLFAFDAPAPGTGKTILAGALGLIVSGAPPALTTHTKSEDEMRKRITSFVIAAAPVVLLDNVKRRLASETLAGVLTTTTWADRILGKSEYVDLPIRTLWLVTGNNLELDTDIARRTVWVRLDAKVDMPWERSGFRNALPEWAVRHRHELVWSTLVFVRHWIAAGQPDWEGRLLGSYEAWSRVVGGILQRAGISGFLANREELYKRMDPDMEQWRAFVGVWWERYGVQPVKVADLYPLAEDIIGALSARNGDLKEQTLRARLGWALLKRRDRRIGDVTIRKDEGDTHDKVNTWRLEPAGDLAAAADLPADSPQEKDPSVDSFAGDAGDCGGVFGAGVIAGQAGQQDGKAKRVRNAPPQSPQPPQSDSDREPKPAGDERGIATAQGEPPQNYRCSGCRMPMSSARVSDVCGWCKKAMREDAR